jgi:hypothetical protein
MADELTTKLPERCIIVQLLWPDQNPQSYLIPIAIDSDAWDDALTRVLDQMRVAVYKAKSEYWRKAASGEP